MHFTNHYQFQLHICDQHGKVYQKIRIKNFNHCIEDLKFSAFQFGALEDESTEPEILLEPLWAKDSKYFCDGFRLVLTNDHHRYAKIYNKKVYRYQFIRAVQKLLQIYPFKQDTTLHAQLTANYKNSFEIFPCYNSAKISVSVVAQSLPLVQRSVKEIVGGKRVGEKPQQKELPVFIAESVVDKMVKIVLRNKKKEQAGILIGELCQDYIQKNLFLICHDLVDIKADKTNSSVAHFRFSPENFYAVQRRISPQAKSQIPVGWYHSHPWLFENETENGQTSIFFSADDFEVMEAAFVAPYQIAIVIGKSTDRASEAAVQMYGWMNGSIAQRGFYMYDHCHFLS